MAIFNEIKGISHPEIWLGERGLMELISSKEYQAQLSLYFQNQVCWAGSERNLTWSDALESTKIWLKDILFDPYMLSKHKDLATWRKLMVTALKPLESTPNIEECAIFWIAKYSLLKSLPYKGIKMRHIIHCSDVCPKCAERDEQESASCDALTQISDERLIEDLQNKELRQAVNDVIQIKGVHFLTQTLSGTLHQNQKHELIQKLKKSCSE
jgi:hypothetical protein